MTISSLLNFGRPAPPERVCGGAKFFGFALLQPARSVFVSLIAFSLVLLRSFGAVVSEAEFGEGTTVL